MRILPADLSNAAIGDAWYEVYESAERFERPSATTWLRDEIAEEYAPDLAREASAYVAVVEGRTVCVGAIYLPLLDNTHAAALEVFVAPEERRRGYGSAMLAHLEGIARERGRRTTYLAASFPLDLPPEGDGAGSASFARSQGYTFGLANVVRSLVLPVDEARLAALSQEAASHDQGYRLEVFTGPVPEAWVADYAALAARIDSDSPTGQLEIDIGSSDVASFRDREARLERQGRIAYGAVALHGDEVVGFSDVSVPRSDRARGYQGGTLVDHAHRGHRLGLALKVANLQQLRQYEPQVHTLVTWNAEANTPMISVNDQLGFVPIERLSEFQKRW